MIVEINWHRWRADFVKEAMPSHQSMEFNQISRALINFLINILISNLHQLIIPFSFSINSENIAALLLEYLGGRRCSCLSGVAPQPPLLLQSSLLLQSLWSSSWPKTASRGPPPPTPPTSPHHHYYYAAAPAAAAAVAADNSLSCYRREGGENPSWDISIVDFYG